jgi:N-acetylmuramoyl-L-alanine amidase
MGVVKATASDIDLLARLLRAEAEGEGEQGMLMVGNVSINRVRSDCLDFKKIRTIYQMVHQNPGGYEAVHKPYFYQRAREKEKRLARRVINGARLHPASYGLWFFRPQGNCPARWYNQALSGRYKAHCFYKPTQNACASVYRTY